MGHSNGPGPRRVPPRDELPAGTREAPSPARPCPPRPPGCCPELRGPRGQLSSPRFFLSRPDGSEHGRILSGARPSPGFLPGARGTPQQWGSLAKDERGQGAPFCDRSLRSALPHFLSEANLLSSCEAGENAPTPPMMASLSPASNSMRACKSETLQGPVFCESIYFGRKTSLFPSLRLSLRSCKRYSNSEPPAACEGMISLLRELAFVSRLCRWSAVALGKSWPPPLWPRVLGSGPCPGGTPPLPAQWPSLPGPVLSPDRGRAGSAAGPPAPRPTPRRVLEAERAASPA